MYLLVLEIFTGPKAGPGAHFSFAHFPADTEQASFFLRPELHSYIPKPVLSLDFTYLI